MVRTPSACFFSCRIRGEPPIFGGVFPRLERIPSPLALAKKQYQMPATFDTSTLAGVRTIAGKTEVTAPPAKPPVYLGDPRYDEYH